LRKDTNIYLISNTQKDIETLLEEAMTQIHDRKYYEAYLDKKVMLMAITFTGKEMKCRLEIRSFNN
jgi:hypothetical protein